MIIEKLYQIYLQYPNICTDTRKITQDCLFFALKGDSFDGNAFAPQALESGAAYVIIDDAAYQNEKSILVEDVLNTLQNLAKYHREQLKIPFIGITGTNGKTTTKELLNSVLSQKFKTYATRGNLNNHIGVPLTLLAIGNDIDLAIIEMGANHQKEIELLCSIAQPGFGLITNVGKAHLEGFGGFEGVKKGKGELYDYLKNSGGLAFINRNNPHLTEMSSNRNMQKVVYYGNSPESEVSAEILSNDPFLVIHLTIGNDSKTIKSNLTGEYNLENILAAVTVGLHFGLNVDEISRGIELYQPENNRSQITKTTSNTLICDYYNANPSSMLVSLDNFASLKADKKVIILGDMFELGQESASEHQAIIHKALEVNANERIFIGKQFYQHKTAFQGKFFESTAEAAETLKKHPIKNASILIKGSRGMRLEGLMALL